MSPMSNRSLHWLLSSTSTKSQLRQSTVALRLAGYLSMRGVSFGYKQHSQPLIDNFDISISPGQRIAIVGASGSGKSTIALLLAGVYRPWTGEVLFDDHLREDIPRSILTSSVAFVDQQITLFSGTIRENLTMWDSSIPDALIIDARRDAAIHDEIARRPLNYSSRVEEGGTNFSVGQRQRLEIARALVNRPSLIVLDEATSSLDAVVEAQIDDALRRRGCACVIIAHRLSTIRDCDEIHRARQGAYRTARYARRIDSRTRRLLPRAGLQRSSRAIGYSVMSVSAGVARKLLEHAIDGAIENPQGEIVLNEPSAAWFIERGSVDVFIVETGGRKCRLDLQARLSLSRWRSDFRSAAHPRINPRVAREVYVWLGTTQDFCGQGLETVFGT